MKLDHQTLDKVQDHSTPLFLVISALITGWGFAVRFVQYLSNRSLGGDEASISLNIVTRTYQELLEPLSYNQAAPPGFLTVEKLAVQGFGNSEYSLRLFPLVSSAIALLAFYRLATHYTSQITALIAIAFFACLPYLVYYATEVKQYSSDVATAILLFLLLVFYRATLVNRIQILLLALIGSVAIWFSHPSIFILSGVELSSFIIVPASSRWQWLRRRLPVYLSWLTSFILLYWLTIRPTLEEQTIFSHINQVSQPIDCYRKPGAVTCLYKRPTQL